MLIALRSEWGNVFAAVCRHISLPVHIFCPLFVAPSFVSILVPIPVRHSHHLVALYSSRLDLLARPPVSLLWPAPFIMPSLLPSFPFISSRVVSSSVLFPLKASLRLSVSRWELITPEISNGSMIHQNHFTKQGVLKVEFKIGESICKGNKMQLPELRLCHTSFDNSKNGGNESALQQP